jgi:hypothetical protein
MATKQSSRLSPKELGSDIETKDALNGIVGYTPLNPTYTAANVTALHDAMVAAQTAETLAAKAFETARDNAVAAERDFHNAILGAKDQVKAQFGKNSNELQALGLKKTSEYKRPSPKKKS